MFHDRKSVLALSVIVLLSLALALLRGGPLHGSTAALIVTVLAQVYLPGYLLARVMGKHRLPHPITRLVWVLVSGLALTIPLGTAARLLGLPVTVYLLALHGMMLALAWLPPGQPADAPAWRWTWRRLPLYIVVLAACVVPVAVNSASRCRFFGFEDQVLFASQAGWLAYHPGETPHDLPLRARQIGVLNGDTRFDTDGWTYNHAAWSWASGVPPAQIIWFDLNPLFVWAAPLAVFALAYELTRREEAAAWAAAALALVGLMTLDNIVYYPVYTAYGRLALFQVNTVRQMSLTLMLPLTLLVGFCYLRTRRRGDWLLMLLAGAALAILHPFQITLFALSIGAAAGLGWLFGSDKRSALIRLLPLGFALAALLALPFIQRFNRAGLQAADTIIDEQAVESSSDEVVARGSFLILPALPLVGVTFIRNPADVFYHPAIALAVALGLVAGVWVRRSRAAQYIFGATLIFLLLNFTPGLTAFFDRFASSVGLLTTLFILPVPLIFGLGFDAALRGLKARSLEWGGAAMLLLAGLLIAFEPIPLEASARDQLQAFNDMQTVRRLRPAQTELTGLLKTLLPDGPVSILMTPGDTASVVIEDLHHVLITGGRGSRNQAAGGDNRFYNQLGANSPWLDSADLNYMNTWGVTHIVSKADQTRLPQLVLDAARFPLLGQTAGQFVFARSVGPPPDAVDGLFVEMNAAYARDLQPRWSPDGFEMVRAGSPDIWEPLAEAWRDLLETEPEDGRARFGLAFAELLMGADDRALPEWEALSAAYPQVPLFHEALAYTYSALNQPDAGARVLLNALNSPSADVRVLAARALLTDTFFYLLDDAALDRVLAVTEQDAVVWDYLAVFDQPDAVRQQAALWMSAGRWEAAQTWLDRLPPMLVAPRDLVAQAAAALAEGDVQAALNRLQPATDPAWLAAKAFWSPDRWADNRAAQMYERLRNPALDSESIPLLAIAESGSPFVMQPVVAQDEAAGTLTVTATYGDFQPQRGYPVRFWRIQVVKASSNEMLASVDAPAELEENVLVRVPVTLPLPDHVEPLTPALVIITPAHNNAVTYPPALVPVTLNRPDSAIIPAGAEAVGLQFGESITLENYTLEAAAGRLDLTLYWQTGAPLAENYQVFVHVLDAAGEIIAQDDSAPVQNQYPTGQWREGVLIADPHRIPVDNLPDGYSVRVGLYRLPDGTRLPVDDPRAEGDSVRLFPR